MIQSRLCITGGIEHDIWSSWGLLYCCYGQPWPQPKHLLPLHKRHVGMDWLIVAISWNAWLWRWSWDNLLPVVAGVIVHHRRTNTWHAHGWSDASRPTSSWYQAGPVSSNPLPCPLHLFTFFHQKRFHFSKLLQLQLQSFQLSNKFCSRKMVKRSLIFLQ